MHAICMTSSITTGLQTVQVQQQYLRVVERAEKEEREVQDLIQMREQAYMDLLEGRIVQPAQNFIESLPNIRTSVDK